MSWRIVTDTDGQQWPCTIVDDQNRSLLAVHNGTPIIRDRALAERVLGSLNAPDEIAVGEVDPIEATHLVDRIRAADRRSHLVDRIRAADRRSPCSLPEMFMLSRTDVHILAMQLDDDAATIARLRAELAEAKR